MPKVPHSSCEKEKSQHTYKTFSMQDACYACNLRTDNTWFWNALHQVSHVFHPFLAFFCCLCGKQLSTTCADDLKLIRSLSLPFCFNLLNTQNAPELKEKLGCKASRKFSLCVIKGNSFGASSTFTSQYSPECCMTLK